ncbi:MAG: VWA domain-containing protein [Syntrophaceae bacterium]|nr:VWA domain-containing protein [Syntrophaceae bacterium]
MDRVLEDFVTALRLSGVRISVAETLDACSAAALVGYGNRLLLKDSLGAALAKSGHEKDLFSDTFDRFFSDFTCTAALPERDDGVDREATLPEDPLSRMLLQGDQASLAAALQEAARAADIRAIRLPTQRSLYTVRILNALGIDGLDSTIRTFSGAGSGGPLAQADALQAARQELVDNVRQYVERQLDLYGRGIVNEYLEEALRKTRLSHLEQRHFEKMGELIQRLVKRLNDIHSRRRKAARRGHLDFKRTLRHNVPYGGFIFDPKWKQRKVNRPDVLVICDISRSMMRLVRFFLLFLYGLNEEILRIRTFVFCSNLIDVSDVFERYPVEVAVDRLQQGTDLPIVMGLTDYARSLDDFRLQYLNLVTRRTTVLFLGDGRNNNADPGTHVLRDIYQRCKRLVWLNPEPRPFWGTGDSEMKRFLPYCHAARECNTLDHLERVIGSLLAATRH